MKVQSSVFVKGCKATPAFVTGPNVVLMLASSKIAEEMVEYRESCASRPGHRRPPKLQASLLVLLAAAPAGTPAACQRLDTPGHVAAARLGSAVQWHCPASLPLHTSTCPPIHCLYAHIHQQQ